MSIRTIDFPDHNDPSFDANEPFDAPNGITYTWNGYGWEVSCGFGDPACIMDGETEFLAYAADTDLADGQAFVDADSIYFKGDQSAFVSIGDEFKAGDDTFTVTAVEVITDATYDEFTKVTVAEDPSGLIGQTLEVEGLCAPIGKRYLLAHGDEVKDCDTNPVYIWNKSVTFAAELNSYQQSKLTLDKNKVELNCNDDLNVYALNGQMDVSIDGGEMSIGGVREMLFDYDGVKIFKNIGDSTHRKHVVDKKYVNEQDDLLRQDIIELEEEIDAIAPSLEYGNWEFEQPSNTLRPPRKGTFFLLTDALAFTDEYQFAKHIVINNYEYDDPSDSDPVDIHTWADANPGELIQLFDAADPDFLLGKIVTVNPFSESTSDGVLEYVRIEIELIQSSGVPNDNADPVTGLYLTRVNIFKEPSGGTASDFVLKTGDDMSGQLEFINKDETGAKYNLIDSTSHLKFTTGNGSGDERSASIYQPGYLAALSTDCNLNVNGYVASSNGTFFGYSTNDTTITYWKPRVSFSADDTGGFYYGDSSSSNNRRVYIMSSYNYLNHSGHTSAMWSSSGINLYYRGSNRVQVTSTGTHFYNPVFLDHNSTRLSLKKDLTASNNNGDSSYGTSGQVLTSNGSNKPPYWAAASGKVDITCSSSGKTKGDMWYCASDGVLYLKVS